MSLPARAMPCQIDALSVQSLVLPGLEPCAPAPWQQLKDDEVSTQQEHDHDSWSLMVAAARREPDPATWPRAWTYGRWPSVGIPPDSKISKFFWLSLRDGQRCRYCAAPLCACNFTTDHLTPIKRGGTNARDNLGLACLSCNARKGNRTEAEYLAAAVSA